MWKKICMVTLSAALLSGTVMTPVSAANNVSHYEWDSEWWYDDNSEVYDFDGSPSRLYGEATRDLLNYLEADSNSSKIKVSGPSNVKTSVVWSDGYDNIYDNGIYPVVFEFAKNTVNIISGNDRGSKGYGWDITGLYYFELTADEPGPVTFRLGDNAISGCYAIVLHYTGNPQDVDGITAQYVKISSGGNVTANFNSYSPVAIIATDIQNAQKLANTYNHDIGSDQMDFFTATISGGTNIWIPIVTCVTAILIVSGTIILRKKKVNTDK